MGLIPIHSIFLSSTWAGPVRSISCRVNGPSNKWFRTYPLFAAWVFTARSNYWKLVYTWLTGGGWRSIVAMRNIRIRKRERYPSIIGAMVIDYLATRRSSRRLFYKRTNKRVQKRLDSTVTALAYVLSVGLSFFLPLRRSNRDERGMRGGVRAAVPFIYSLVRY